MMASHRTSVCSMITSPPYIHGCTNVTMNHMNLNVASYTGSTVFLDFHIDSTEVI